MYANNTTNTYFFQASLTSGRAGKIKQVAITLKGIIDRVDFNATIHGQRNLDDDRLGNHLEEYPPVAEIVE